MEALHLFRKKGAQKLKDKEKTMNLESITPILVLLLGMLWLRHSERIKIDEQTKAQNKKDYEYVEKQTKFGLKSLAETQKMLITIYGNPITKLDLIDSATYKHRLMHSYQFLLKIQEETTFSTIIGSEYVRFSSLLFIIAKEIERYSNQNTEVKPNLQIINQTEHILQNLKT
jgi:hypothetical protein